ncbi:MAG: NADH-quinone oxidoreductase subunit H [Bacteroidales bacterium]|jgi:NADH-quinone oxidoreductase subunit H|nr:NADH-quinone oxidoreductase subunit H [Bacteroidales bacterium]
MENIAAKLLWTFLGLLIVLNWGMLKTSIVRKIVARVGGRYGIRWYQPWINLIKLYGTRGQLSHGVMFYLGPVFRIAGGVGLFLFMPLIFGDPRWSNFAFAGDLILLLYFKFFGMLGMALGAGEGGHPYSAIGVSRGLSQYTTVEIPFTLGIIALAVQYDTLSLTEMVAAQQGGIANWTIVTNPIASAALLFSMLGIFMHAPFDLVKAPNEIPIGPPTEYHGSYLGVLRTNAAIMHITEAVLFMNLLFGGANNWIELIIKTFLIYFITVFIGVVFPRFRIEQSVRFFLGVPLILGILAIILIM